MQLQETYQKKIVPDLIKEMELKNRFMAPRLSKVVINVGLGRASQQPSFKDKLLPGVMQELGIITGQKPSPRPAKKSIAGFKVREGHVIGTMVTLRGKRMYDFVEKMIAVVFPRLRDFRGIALKNVDASGNLNLGFKEHIVFPEMNPDNTAVDFGLQVTLVTQAHDRDQAIALYRKLGFLFKKESPKKK